jgi:uncharacterized protein DUF998
VDTQPLYVVTVARAGAGAAVFALAALAALHALKPEVRPSSTMISQYALGRHGWMMSLCFAAFAAASACLFVALLANVPTLLGRVGLAFLLSCAVGLGMAARFPMDPVSTTPSRMSLSGRMHGVSFMIGVPSQILAVLLLSLALGTRFSTSPLLLALTCVIWLSLAVMIAIMLMVGPGKEPNPDGPERFVGLPNRLFMISFAAWVIAAAWPLAR